MKEPRRLGNIERALFLVDQVASLNVTAVAHVRGAIDPEEVRRALAMVQAQHPLLQVTIAEKGGAPCYVAVPTAIPMKLIPRRDSDDWYSEATAERNHPLPRQGMPLARVTLLHGAAESELIATLHHVLCDGFSIVYFLRDLLCAIAALRDGATAPAPYPERPSLEQLLPDATRGLPGLRRSFGFARDQLRTLLWERPQLLAEEAEIPITERRSGFVPFTASPEDTKALATAARRHGATVHGALCAALLLATSAEFAQDKRRGGEICLGCCTPVSLRRQLQPPIGDELGLFVGSAVTFHRLHEETPFWQLACQVSTAVHKARDAGLPAVALATQSRLLPPRISPERVARNLYHRLFGTVSVTNLGVLDIPRHWGALELTGLHFAPSNNPFGSLVSLSVTTLHGRMFLNFNYNEAVTSLTRRDRIVQSVQAALLSAARSAATGK